MKKSTLFALIKKAKERGFVRDNKVIQDYVTNAPKAGRPQKIDQIAGKQVIETLTRNSTRQYTLSRLCLEIEKKYGWKIGRTALASWLKKTGYSSAKLTPKSGLNNKQMRNRLRFVWEKKDWSLDQWKKVIWSDETSVTLGQIRGKRRIWRLPFESYNMHVVRRRWKCRKEFMFWACFSYVHKGPCYVWPAKEMAKMKKTNDAEVAKYNTGNEARLRAEWEIANGFRRLDIKRNKPGKKPEWCFTKDKGKWVRTSKGGIDAPRYKNEILLPLYFLFLESLKGSDWIAQEDMRRLIRPSTTRIFGRHEAIKLSNGPRTRRTSHQSSQFGTC